LRLESVPNANEQAKTAAASICKNNIIYSSLPWFWSDQFGLKLQIAGLNHGYDKVVLRGDSDTGRSFAVFYLKNGKVISSDCINRPQEFMVSKHLINKEITVNPIHLADENIAPKELLNASS